MKRSELNKLKKELSPKNYTFADYQILAEIESDPIAKEIIETNLRLVPEHKFKLFADGISLARKQYLKEQQYLRDHYA